MPKCYSTKHILKILQDNGFVVVSQKGSHIRLRKYGNPILTTIVVANQKEIPYGTFKSILFQTNLNKDDFEKK